MHMNKTTPKYNRRLVLLHTRIAEMSLGEVRDRIGTERMTELMARDPRPLFVELIAGHEGLSTGRLAALNGPGRPAKKFWTKERIAELAQKLKPGAPVFSAHASGRKARRAVGVVMDAGLRTIAGVLSACGLCWVSDPETKHQIAAGELDTCSVEAEVECYREKSDADEPWIVSAVRKVTGIALGNSREVKPGFPGAAVLAAVEEFNPESPAPPDDAAKFQEMERRLHELSAKLAGYEAQEERQKRVKEAEQVAEKLLSGKNVSAAEKAIILSALREPTPGDGPDLAAAVQAKVEAELSRINHLRELWQKERIPAPPERATQSDDPFHNPLIPRPRGW